MRQGLNDIDDSFFLYALGSLRSRNTPAAHPWSARELRL